MQEQGRRSPRHRRRLEDAVLALVASPEFQATYARRFNEALEGRVDAFVANYPRSCTGVAVSEEEILEAFVAENPDFRTVTHTSQGLQFSWVALGRFCDQHGSLDAMTAPRSGCSTAMVENAKRAAEVEKNSALTELKGRPPSLPIIPWVLPSGAHRGVSQGHAPVHKEC